MNWRLKWVLVRTSVASLAFQTIVTFAAVERASAAREPKLAPITNFMRVYGPPDFIEVAGKQNRAYHWRLKTEAGFVDGAEPAREPFTCDVTALVAPNGRIIRVATRPGNPGAAIIGSIGAFGPLCRSTLDLKSSGLGDR